MNASASRQRKQLAMNGWNQVAAVAVDAAVDAAVAAVVAAVAAVDAEEVLILDRLDEKTVESEAVGSIRPHRILLSARHRLQEAHISFASSRDAPKSCLCRESSAAMP